MANIESFIWISTDLYRFARNKGSCSWILKSSGGSKGSSNATSSYEDSVTNGIPVVQVCIQQGELVNDEE